MLDRLRRWIEGVSSADRTDEADRSDRVGEEVEFYLEMRSRELEEEGMAPAEARRAARRAFGDVRGISSASRRHLRGASRRRRLRQVLESIGQDVRVTVRGWRRRPGFAALVSLTLAVGMGATTAIFGLVDAALLGALPFEDADDIVVVRGVLSEDPTQVRGASYPEISDWRRGARRLEGLSAWTAVGLTVTGGDDAERIVTELVEPQYFDLLRVTPLLGRTFRDGENAVPDAAPVVVLHQDLWERRFGGSRDVLGETLELEGRPHTVIGVLPREFAGFSLQAEAWVPMMMAYLVRERGDLEERGERWLAAVGRVAPGVSVEAAAADLARVARDLEAELPDSNTGRTAGVVSLRSTYLGSTETVLQVLLGAGAFLLLVAIANATNLLLTRGASRGTEIALRRALGSGRGRLVQQLMVESLMLAALAGVMGLALAVWGLDLLEPLIPAGALPPFVEPRVDAGVVLFGLGLLAVTGILTGLLPALKGARGDLAQHLRTSRAAEGWRWRGGRMAPAQLLVAGEVAVTVVLLVGAGLVARTLAGKLAVEPGYVADELHLFRVGLPPDSQQGDAPGRFMDDVARELAAVPEIQEVTYSSDVPLRGGNSASILHLGDPEERLRYYRHRVAPGFLATMGVSLLQGRGFQSSDDADAPGVAVVSDEFVQRFLPGGDAVGRTLYFGVGPDAPTRTIVGVVGTVRWRDLTTDLMGEASDPDVYFPYAQQPTAVVEIAARVRGEAPGLLEKARAAVARVDPDVPVYLPARAADLMDAQLGNDRLMGFLFAVFAGGAMVLASVGVYGAIAFAVTQRRREIAIRMSLGAPGRRVRQGVLLQAAGLAALGCVAGLGIAAAASRTLSTLLFGVKALDPWTYIGTVLVAIAGVLTAAWVPAWRAAHTDPQLVLRGD